MARITIEDCLLHVENRFKLVLEAAKISRKLCSGIEPPLPWENDKPTVMALRMIAKGYTEFADPKPESAVAEEAG